MATNDLRRRGIKPGPQTNLGPSELDPDKAQEPHPAGEVRHAVWVQVIRMLLFATWFNGTTVVIHATQLLGTPLYFLNKDYYYSYMAMTKASYSLVVTTITEWFSPTVIRVSWHPDLADQFHKTAKGRLETRLPERLLLVANHQIYTDWIYLWWFSYTSKMHGHIFIILKESLKYVPFIGPGMMFFSFIFMARKWASDKARIQHRLRVLKKRHGKTPSSAGSLDPMWLLIFPEGTNLSANTRKRSVQWAEHEKMADLKYQLLPRSTGLQLCLDELGDTIDWVYDCTVAYEGTPPGGYAQDIFTLRSTLFQGRPPKSVNMYWRRFAVKDIPIHEPKAFEAWVLQRWREKDQILEYFFSEGRFPAADTNTKETGHEEAYIETTVRLRTWTELGQIFVVLATVALLVNITTQLLVIFGRGH